MSLASLSHAISHLEALAPDARIRDLIALSGRLPAHAPSVREPWEVIDTRQSAECQDELHLYARREGEGVRLAATVGAESTTITRALLAFWIENLSGERAEDILALESTVVPRILGDALLRQRSASAYTTLRRVQEAVGALK
jgi:sulfur transfer protein SufE